MGMKLRDILLLLKTLEDSDFKDLTIIELGEQELKLWQQDFSNIYIKNWIITQPRLWPVPPPRNRMGFYSKDFFNYYFKECISIDFDCHCNKSIKVNLENDVFKQNIDKQFDILTNIGTTEHVGQIMTTTHGSKVDEIVTIKKNPQYYTFKNIHNLVKKNGIFFHNLPYAKDKNNLLIHGAYCYNEIFFEQLADKNNYTILTNKLYTGPERSNFMDAILIKNTDDEFMTEEEFVKLEGLFETSLKRKN